MFRTRPAVDLRPALRLGAALALLGVTAATPGGDQAFAASPPAPVYAVSVLPVPYVSAAEMSPVGHLAGVAATHPANGALSGVPFIWSPSAALVILPLPAGTTRPSVLDVNSGGWVLGTIMSASGATLGVVWKPAGATYLPLIIPPPAGRVSATPTAMDDANRVVGSAGISGTIFSAPFTWSEGAGSQDLLALGYPNDRPVSMSPGGWVAAATTAYRLGDPGSATPLPTLPSPYQYPYTYGIADDGDRFVIGHYPSSRTSDRLFRLDAATGTWTALWASDMPSPYYGLWDVNAQGDAVGSRYSGAEVSWTPGDPMLPIQSHLAGGYAGVPSDIYPGLPITGASGISNGRGIVATALMGNNGGRIVRLSPDVPCTSVACLTVTGLTVAATNPRTCSGATRTATATVVVRDHNGAAVPDASVRVVLMTQNTTAVRSGTTGRTGQVKLSASVGTCEGTVTALVESVTKPGSGLDRSTGVLIRSVIPTVR